MMNVHNLELLNSRAVREEIQRFESVHPHIYAIYDLLEQVEDPCLQDQLREHVVCIEDSFVNSQEWTLSRTVPELKLGVVGSLTSGKSALVHRYLTGSYMQEESPEGGRFKKEIVVDDRSYLLLIRDEGGPPELQFCSWVDAVILVFSVEDEMSFQMLYNFYAKIAHYRNTADLPMILVGTQDALTQNSPRLIDDTKAKKLAADLKRCPYFETCAMYGLNVERVFQDAAQLIVEKKHYHTMVSLSNSSSSLPSTPHSVRSNPFPGSAPFPGPNSLSAPSANHSNSQHHQQQHQQGGGSGTMGSMGSRKGSRDSIREGSQGSNQGSDGRGPLQPSPSSTPNFTRKSRRKSNLFTPNKGKPQNSETKNGDTGSLPNHAQRGIGSGRSIPVKQGYLYKRSSKALNKEWKKKYVTLCDDGRLTYHPSLHDYMDDVHGKEIRLLNTTVKVPGRRPPLARANTQAGSTTTSTSSMNSGTNGIANNMKAMTISGHAGPAIHSNQGALSRDTSNPMLSQRDVQEAKIKSTSLPRDTVFSDATIISNSSVTPGISNGVDAPLSFPQMGMTSKDGHGSKKKHRRMRSSGGNKSLDHPHLEESEDCEFIIVSLDNRQWNFEATNSEERDGWVVAVEQRILACLQTNESAKGKGQLSNLEQSAIVETIRKVRGNGSCVDCEGQNPDWSSLNLGSLMCIECSGIHRNLGSHISRVRSLTLDEWPPELAQVMMLTGNALTNSVFEVSLHGQVKPTVTSGREEKEKWIRAKYERKEFIAPYPYPERNLGQQLMEAVIREDIRAVMLLLVHARENEVNYCYGDGDGRSALHLSCAMGNVVITQLLIWYKLNVNIADADGRTALAYARSVEADDCVKVLVMNGCQDVGDYNSNMNNSTLLRVPQGPGRGHHPTPTTGGDKMSSVI